MSHVKGTACAKTLRPERTRCAGRRDSSSVWLGHGVQQGDEGRLAWED